MPEWTSSQKNAIDSRGLDLIVSAGAGSGKTTVLTQRIIERIEKGDSVTDFLVVTFTKASASDLREKLYMALAKLSAEHPSDKRFRTQLYLLPSAHISTIHSFCMEVVRANFQSLGLSPKVRIADEEEERMLASEVMEDLMDACYEEEDAPFSLLSDIFSGAKDDGPLSETMRDLYNRIRAFDGYFEWLEAQEAHLRRDGSLEETGLFDTCLGKKLQQMVISRCKELLEACEDLSEFASLYGGGTNFEAITEVLQQRVSDLLAAAKESYRVFLHCCTSYGLDLPRMTAKGVDSQIKEYFTEERDRIKKELKELEDNYSGMSEKTIASQFFATADVLHAIRIFLGRFEQLLDIAKRDKCLMSFSDSEHLLLKLLEQNGEPTPLCLSLRSQIKEIFVDEYQDVSPLQDRIFRLLSSGSDRFMVGDVKQSIYRFRNAYPDIFLDYKENFADYPPKSGEPNARIFLRENFRSGRFVIDFVNLLFSKVTLGTPYEREYAGEELVFAKKTESAPLPVTIALSAFESRKSAEDTEKEARYITSEIRRLMESASCEGKEGMRPYRYSDITLLFRTIKGKTAPYEKALREAGIPFAITKEEPFFEQPEILLALSILKAIDDPTDDISLFSAMRSPAFGFSADELYEIRLCSAKGPFIRALRKAAEGSGILAEKTRLFLEQLNVYREMAEGKPCHQFVWELYTRTGLLRSCGRRGRRSLLNLYEYARKFESGGYKGLAGLIAYFKAAQERGANLPAGSDTAGETDHVTLTTIHASKGLEYAAVFLCDCDQDLFRNYPSPYTLLRDDGLFFKLKDYERLTVSDTILNRYAKAAEHDAEVGEELRKLYVACTRAREKLYVVGAVKAAILERGTFHPHSPKCFLDFILYATSQEVSPCFERILIGETNTELGAVPEATVNETQAQSFLTPEVVEAVRFVYPFHDQLVPTKVSVSDLKQQGEDQFVSEYKESHLLVPPDFLTVMKVDEPTMRGTANHCFMQFCSFDYIEKDGIRAEAERLKKNGFLTEEMVSLLDFAGLKTFFASSLYARMRHSAVLYREQRFAVRVPASRLGGSSEENILLQGVVDCFFEDSDGTLTVVDYKTDHQFDPAKLRGRHEFQLKQYKEAVELMTGKKVGKTVIWSFAIGKEI